MNFKKILALGTLVAMTASYLPGINVAATETSAIPMESLKGYWTFENVNGSTIIDDSEHGKDATLRGNATITEDGKNNKGLKLTGEKGTFLSIPSIFNMAQENVSISFWVKAEAVNNRSQNTILVQQEGSGRSILYYTPGGSGDKLGTFVSGANSYSNGKLDQNKWVNVAMVTNYTKKEIKFYINGKLDSTHTVSSLASSTDPLRIGDHKGNDGLALNGIVDEVMIFGKCLSDEEVLNIYYENVDVASLKEELSQILSTAYETYDLASDYLTGDLVDEFSSEINKAEDLVLSDSVEGKEFVSQISTLKSLNEQVSAAINEKIGDDVLIKADINNVFREIGKSLFGANHRYHKDGYGTYDTENLKIKDEFDALYKESNFGALRYPGGKVANLFEWKKSIGPVDERSKTIHGDPEQVPEFPYFGVDEAATYAEENNSELAYVYNMGNGNKNDAADLVEYLNCEVGENPNGGIDWAKVRAENGRVEPYNVTHFEIGNEFQLLSEQAYWTLASGDPMGAYIDGGEFQFNNQLVVEYEDWRSSTAGRSNGEANQEKMIRYYPIVENTLVLTVGGETWRQVDALEGQGTSNVFVYNNETGRITFGDGENGNIPAQGSQIKVSYKAHRDGYVDYYAEMKKVDPEIKIYSSYDKHDFVTRMGTEKAYDGVVTHPYSGTINSGDANYYEKILYRAEEKVDVARGFENKIKEVLGEEKAKDVSVVVSEYGIFNDSSRFVKSQINALYTAKSIIGFADIASIPYATKHCLVDFPGGDLLGPGGQAIIQSVYNSNNEIEFIATPSAKVFTLFNNMTGNHVLNETVINNKTVYGNLEAVDTMITKDDEGNLYLMLVNTAKEEVSVNISVDGFDFKGKSGEGMLVDGPTFDAENTIDNKDNVDIEEFTVDTITTNNFRHTLTPHSVTAIKINAEVKEEDKDDDKEEVTEVFTTALEITVEMAEAITEEELKDVVPAAKNEFISALNEAKEILEAVANGEEISQEAVNNSFDRLSKAMHLLEHKGNKTELMSLIEQIKGLNQADFTAESWSALNDVLNSDLVQDVVKDENALESDITAAYTALSDAFTKLQVKSEVDKSRLQTLVNKIDELDSEKYITSTWESLDTLLEAANTVLLNEKATQGEVDEAYNNLIRAYLQLRLTPDKELLEGLISKAEALNSADYTVESWSALENTLVKARAVFENKEASSEEVTKAEKELEKAIDNLVASSTTGNSNNNNNSASAGTTTNSSSNTIVSNTNQTTTKGNLPNTGDLGGVTSLLIGAVALVGGALGLKKRR